MTKYQSAPAAENVIDLFDDKEFSGPEWAGNQASVFDSMMANPRLSTAANDEPQSSNLVRLAPERADCRQARLLCMWVEILAENEIA